MFQDAYVNLRALSASPMDGKGSESFRLIQMAITGMSGLYGKPIDAGDDPFCYPIPMDFFI
jgi:hypothetical protein